MTAKKIRRGIISFSITLIIVFEMFTISGSAKTNHLNIEIYMDYSFMSKNGVPASFTTRYNEITSLVYQFYLIGLGIELDFNFVTNNEHLIKTTADNCKNYSDGCKCGACLNSGPYHHNNFNVIRKKNIPAATSDTARLLLTAHSLCDMDNGNHGYVYGVCWRGYKQMICRDYDSDDPNNKYYKGNYYSRMTFAHEIGHMFKVADHYNDANSVADCIWGANRRTVKVAKNFTICSVCRATLNKNKGLYNNT